MIYGLITTIFILGLLKAVGYVYSLPVIQEQEQQQEQDDFESRLNSAFSANKPFPYDAIHSEV